MYYVCLFFCVWIYVQTQTYSRIWYTENIPVHQPFGVFLQLVEDGVVAEFEDEVEFPLPPEHLDEIDEVGML